MKSMAALPVPADLELPSEDRVPLPWLLKGPMMAVLSCGTSITTYSMSGTVLARASNIRFRTKFADDLSRTSMRSRPAPALKWLLPIAWGR